MSPHKVCCVPAASVLCHSPALCMTMPYQAKRTACQSRSLEPHRPEARES
jgi:hypothetical protein